MSRSISPAERKRLRAMLAMERRLRDAGVMHVAGVDEAGRGALAGPVVAAAVMLPWPPLLIRGLNDSKRLSPAERERLYAVIACAAGVGVGISESDVIDRMNIRQANLLAMRQAVEALPQPPDHLLIDGIDGIDWPGPQTTVIGGDGKSLSIAAASVVAKVTRDRAMVAYDTQYPEYGFAGHKGYGTAAHIAALRRHGPCPIHRRSFRIRRKG